MNMLERSVIARDLWSRYRIKFIENKKIVWEDIWALKGINFEIAKSDTICILGENGSGKTTLLKLIAGLIKGEKGELSVNGSVSALLEIGTGFHPDLTGRENVYLNSSLFGLSTEEIDRRIDKIIEFSDLGRFINAPVKSYSQGMSVRLGFSIAVHLGPDILLIDDSLAVGDASFQKKCIKKIEELKELNKTLIMVTHDVGLAKMLSRRGIILRGGNLIKDGAINNIATFYGQTVGFKKGIASFSSNDLLCIFNNGRMVISVGESTIIGADGINYSFNVLEKEVRPDSGTWETSNIINNAIHATRYIRDKNIDLQEKCIIEQKGDNMLSFTVNVQSNNNVTIKNFNLNVSFSELLKSAYINNLGNRFNESSYYTKLDTGNLIIFSSETEEIDNDLIFIIKPVKFNNKIRGYLQKRKDAYSYVLTMVISDDGKFFRDFNEFIFSMDIKILRNKKDLFSYLLNEQKEKSIQSADCSIVTDESKISIKYKEIEVTNLSGLIASISSNSKWHDSNHAIWDINKVSSDAISVRTEWEGLPIIQNWRIKLTENILKWDINLEVKERFEAKEQKVGILLTDRYQTWLSSYEEGEFPKFSTVWQDIKLRNKASDSIGTRSPDGTQLPSVLFYIKDANSDNSPLIQNADELSSSRSLNAKLPSRTYEPGAYHYFSGSIELIEDKKKIEEYLTYHRNRLKELRTISDGGYSLAIEEGRAKITFNDIEITKSSGLNSRFSYLGVEYEAAQADWGIEKLGDNRIVCQLVWYGLPFLQHWVFEFLGKDKILVEMFFKLSEEVKIENVSTELYLSSAYREWFTEQEKGNFLSPERVGDIAPVKLLYNKSRILGVNSASNLPSLALFSLYDKPILSTICKLFKDTEDSIMFSILDIDTEPEKKLGTGEFLFNRFEIVLQKGAEESSIFVSGSSLGKKDQAELKTSEFNFVFDDGRGRLFYRDTELTKAFCIFTSVCSSKIWYDSAQAAWKQISSSENHLELEGVWPRLPLIQNWKFFFEDARSLLIEIRSRLYKEFNIEREQFSIMLTDEYNKWEVEKQASGIFQPNFSNSYDIISYRMWSGKYGQGKIKISSQQPNLPAVYIDFPLVKNDFWAVIENSDDISRSRVIQAQRVYSGREIRNSDTAFDYFKMRISAEP